MKCRKDCYYYANGTDSCDYYLITGVRRGCSPDNCTRYVKALRHNEIALNLARNVKSERWKEKYHEMYSLYKAGKYDKEIAEEIGCCVNTVKVWRKREGLISQTDRQKKLKEEQNIESKT